MGGLVYAIQSSVAPPLAEPVNEFECCEIEMKLQLATYECTFSKVSRNTESL